MSEAASAALSRARLVRWAVATAAAHALGGLFWALPGIWLLRSPGEVAGPTSGIVMLALTVLAAALQGAVLGLAQAAVLRDLLPIRVSAWTLATSAGVIGGWILVVMAAPVVGPLVSGPVALLTVAAIGGGAFGALVGGAQGAVLSRALAEVPAWVIANVFAWAAALVITAALMRFVGQETTQIFVGAAVAAVLAGVALGGVTGAALVRMLR